MGTCQPETPAPWSGTPNLEIGPPPTARQLKVAAIYSLGQLLAVADLKARAVRRKKQQQVKLPPGRSAAAAGGPGAAPSRSTSPVHIQLGGFGAGNAVNAHTAVTQLRQSAAKRRAEEAADAAATDSLVQRLTSAEVSAVSRKRIAIVPPLGSPPVPPGAAFGHHSARRGGGGAAAAAGGSSLARVYGSRIRVGQLPEDYNDCFVGLNPEPKPDPSLDLEDLGSPGPQRKHRGGRGGVGAEALAAASAAAAGEAPMGAVGVRGEMPFLLSPSASLQVPPHVAAPQGLGIDPGLGAAAAPGGLLAPFLAQEAALAGLSLGGAAALGLAGVAGGGAGVPADLMLDAEEDDSDGDEDDGEGDGDVDMAAQLGDAFEELEADGAMGTQGYGGAAFGGYGGVVQGLGGPAEEDGGLVAGGGGGGAAEDDGAMVEEF